MPQKIRFKQINSQELHEAINEEFKIKDNTGKNRIDSLHNKIEEIEKTIEDVEDKILEEINGRTIITVHSLTERDEIDASTLKENTVVRVVTDTSENYFFWDLSLDPPNWTIIKLDGGDTTIDGDINISDVVNLENTISWGSI